MSPDLTLQQPYKIINLSRLISKTVIYYFVSPCTWINFIHLLRGRAGVFSLAQILYVYEGKFCEFRLF